LLLYFHCYFYFLKIVIIVNKSLEELLNHIYSSSPAPTKSCKEIKKKTQQKPTADIKITKKQTHDAQVYYHRFSPRCHQRFQQ